MAQAGDIIQAVAKFTQLGQSLLNVYHFGVGDTTFDGDVVEDIAVLLDTAYAVIDNSQSPSLLYDSISVKNLTQDEFLGEVDWPTMTVGQSASDPLPSGVAALITFPTTRLGSRGRKFLPGFSEVTTTDGLFTPATVAALASFGAYFVAPFIGTVSGNAYLPGIVRTAGSFLSTISAVASNIPAYQRRRKVGVGG